MCSVVCVQSKVKCQKRKEKATQVLWSDCLSLFLFFVFVSPLFSFFLFLFFSRVSDEWRGSREPSCATSRDGSVRATAGRRVRPVQGDVDRGASTRRLCAAAAAAPRAPAPRKHSRGCSRRHPRPCWTRDRARGRAPAAVRAPRVRALCVHEHQWRPRARPRGPARRRPARRVPQVRRRHARRAPHARDAPRVVPPDQRRLRHRAPHPLLLLRTSF